MAARDERGTTPIQLPRVWRGKGLSVLSVTGGKGGVGKSSVAANLAVKLGALGGRVLLMDADLGMANADQMLGVQAAATLLDVVRGDVSLEDAVTPTPWGISLLAASSGRVDMAELSAALRKDLIDAVRHLGREYDYVVVDTAAGIAGLSVDFAACADMVFAVATPDPASVRDAFAIMKVLSKERGVTRIQLIANMVATQREGVDLFSRISGVAARFLPVELALGGVLVRDPVLQRAVRDRLPAVTVYPNSLFARQIGKVATFVLSMEREHAAAAAHGGHYG